MTHPEKRYDVAISYAGEDRTVANSLALALRSYMISVFYDGFAGADLIGKPLYTYLKEVYGERCDHCIILVSPNYAQKSWTMKVEWPAATAKSFSADTEFILPVVIEPAEIPGLEATTGYVDLRQKSIEEAAHEVAKKILGRKFSGTSSARTGNVPKRLMSHYPKLTTDTFSLLFCERLFHCERGEAHFLAITGIHPVQLPVFACTMDLLRAKLEEEDRYITLQFYLLDPKAVHLEKFAKESEDSVEGLREAISRTESALRLLCGTANTTCFRTRILYYDSLPTVNLFQIDDTWWIRPYRLDGRQSFFDAFSVGKEAGDTSGTLIVQNILKDVRYRARVEDISWTQLGTR